ncbi:MAG: hypothetical protein BGO43_14010 [Gammaproteobacteria bacterium 39-13]|jgi:hypothetical protein|nr:hypothetical protein [Gammaproteobacteria bacterium]OJV85799.1 MAG: hypothetical protein BGO43_14010 [Gammaproteobacteria bacterium 39-13]
MGYHSQKIISLIEEILPLLKIGDGGICLYYYEFYKNILERLRRPHELDKIASDIQRTYGGMATFNDIALYQNGEILMDETDKFIDLRRALYAACEEAILTFRK